MWSGLIPAHAGKTLGSPVGRRAHAAHPRSRGENGRSCVGAFGWYGSSPLTRGKHQGSGLGRCRLGLIPAHAGKTMGALIVFARLGAHPRSRGENGKLSPVRTRTSGSSPLTRGKRSCGPWGRGRTRLIPAHAGKTHMQARGLLQGGAHPRSRGENPRPRSASLRRQGSSPLTRGKHSRAIRWASGLWLIPAHAGKTSSLNLSSPLTVAHPRSRGENSARRRPALRAAGSSPLTRGKRSVVRIARLFGRLIPAHAGKTGPRGFRRPRRWAHPRSRGENVLAGGAGSVGRGSSPLTRGKLIQRLINGDIVRLIPAHAGKTFSCPVASMTSRAHPRSRGENEERCNIPHAPHGSSPLTRGKPMRRG